MAFGARQLAFHRVALVLDPEQVHRRHQEQRQQRRGAQPADHGQGERLVGLRAVLLGGGHRGQAADKLGVDGKTLYNWLSEERAEREGKRPAA